MTSRVRSHFAFIDSVLPENQFEKLCQSLDALPFRRTAAGTSIWKSIEQENPQQSVTTFAWPCLPLGGPTDLELPTHGGFPVRFYPTETPLDGALEVIKSHATRAHRTVGREGDDWAGLICSVYVYGRGTRAGWHTDELIYTGAFVYYVHRQWDAEWGGELLMRDAHNRSDCGLFVSPLPNRLVFLKAGTPHCVTRMSEQAGEHYRRSLAGFFVTPTYAEQLLRKSPR